MRALAYLALAAVLALAGCTASPAAGPASPAGPAAPTTAAPTPTPSPTGPPRTVVALGDSLSRGFDACDRYGDCPSVSWSTGGDARVDSVAARFAASTDSPLRVHDVAASGVSIDDLARQVDAAVALKPDLATVLIGANDLCRRSVDEMTSTTAFAAAATSQLARLSAGSPGTLILVASVPDVTALLPAASGDPTARFVWSRLGGCATVLAAPRSTSAAAEARRQAVRDRADAYDAALATACGLVPRCVWDGGALHAYRPELRQLSALDYFHPSVAGLHEVAGIEWSVLQRSGGLSATP